MKEGQPTQNKVPQKPLNKESFYLTPELVHQYLKEGYLEWTKARDGYGGGTVIPQLKGRGLR